MHGGGESSGGGAGGGGGDGYADDNIWRKDLLDPFHLRQRIIDNCDCVGSQSVTASGCVP